MVTDLDGPLDPAILALAEFFADPLDPSDRRQSRPGPEPGQATGRQHRGTPDLDPSVPLVGFLEDLGVRCLSKGGGDGAEGLLVVVLQRENVAGVLVDDRLGQAPLRAIGVDREGHARAGGPRDEIEQRLGLAPFVVDDRGGDGPLPWRRPGGYDVDVRTALRGTPRTTLPSRARMSRSGSGPTRSSTAPAAAPVPLRTRWMVRGQGGCRPIVVHLRSSSKRSVMKPAMASGPTHPAAKAQTIPRRRPRYGCEAFAARGSLRTAKRSSSATKTKFHCRCLCSTIWSPPTICSRLLPLRK